MPNSVALVILILVHDLDHIRQRRALSLEIYGVGAVALVAAITMVLIAWRRHEISNLAAVVVGFGTILGLLLVHVAPRWWPFSDPYPEANADVLSWVIVIAMMVVGFLLGVAGLRALRKGAVVAD